MRNLFIVCLTLGLFGCTEGTSSPQDAATDVAANRDTATATDGAMTAPDAPAADARAADGPRSDGPAADGPGATCAETMICIGSCTAGNMATCVPACIARLSPASATYFDDLQACGQPACYVSDGGEPPCATPGSSTCSTCISTNCGPELQACLNH